jgi:hypothetical protein
LDVLTAQEAGQAGQSIADEAVLLFATEHQRAVLTLDRWDFVRLHERQPKHAGIIVCSHDEDVVRQASRIEAAIQALPSLTNQLVRVNRPN